MTPDEILDRLKAMLVQAQELALQRHPALEGDVQIVIAILTDKLRNLDPTGSYPHPVEYE